MANETLKNVSSIATSAAAGGMGLLGQSAGGAISSYYQEKAADKAYKRSKDYFDYVAEYNNPTNQVQRLKDAGLSVGLMYGMQGSGGQQEAVSAPQAGNINTSNESGMGIQSMMAAKQMELLDSQINKTNAEAENLRGIERDKAGSVIQLNSATISNLIAQTKNEEERNSLIKFESQLKEFELNFKEDTRQINIETLRLGMEKLDTELDITLNNRAISNATKQTVIDTYNATLANTVADTALKNSNISLNEETKNKLVAEIKYLEEQVAIGKMNAETAKEGLNNAFKIACVNSNTSIKNTESTNKNQQILVAQQAASELTSYSLKEFGKYIFTGKRKTIGFK